MERPDAPRSASLWSMARCPFQASSGLCGMSNSSATALAHAGEALVEYRVANRARRRKSGSLVLAVRPVQIDPYWQHGGHAAINAIGVEGRQVSVNDRCYAALSQKPDFVTVADFDDGDVVRLIEKGPRRTVRKRRSDSALLSAAFEFAFSLAPGTSVSFVISSPMRDRIAPRADRDFGVVRDDRHPELAGKDRPAQDHGRATAKSATPSRRRRRSSL